MRKTWITVLALVVVVLAVVPASAVTPGDKTPDFTLSDQNGKSISSADLANAVVVLEWIGPGCPFVVRHGKEGTMKTTAEKYKDKTVIWLGVITGSGATAEAAKKWAATAGIDYPILLDTKGEVAKAFGAKTTPHMFVLNKGKVAYTGAIDNDPQGKQKDGRVNYVAQALDQILAGQTVATPETKPYGCAVKVPK